MAHAYTPGLRVTGRTVLRRRRSLPLPGEVLVKPGQAVKAEEVVARAELPGNPVLVNAVNILGVTPGELKDYLLKRVGEGVSKDEILGETKGLFGWFKTTLSSPVAGTLESISEVTGQMVLREPPRPLELRAFVDGTAVETLEQEGVVVETVATFIQGIFGIGGETVGELVVAVEAPDQELTRDRIPANSAGKILVGGSLVTAETLKEAVRKGVRGIVVGGFGDRDLRELLGHDIGVAITGREQVGLTLIMTEGFGHIPMAERTFRLLRERNGTMASISGATQIRAGVVRPEIIIPFASETRTLETQAVLEKSGMKVGEPVRIIRDPHFGKIGKVKALPVEPAVIETEARVRILEVEFPGGENVVIPRANVEILEE